MAEVAKDRRRWREAWAKLAEVMKRVGYGCIFNLEVRDGAPVLPSNLGVEYDRLLKPGSVQNTKPGAKDAEAKTQFKNLRELCERERDVLITVLFIQDGLPHRVKYRKEEKIQVTTTQ